MRDALPNAVRRVARRQSCVAGSANLTLRGVKFFGESEPEKATQGNKEHQNRSDYSSERRETTGKASRKVSVFHEKIVALAAAPLTAAK